MEEDNIESLETEFTILPYILQMLEKINPSTEELDIVKAVGVYGAIPAYAMPGVNLTQEQQQELHDKNTKRLERKRQLITKYEQLPIFQFEENGNTDVMEI
ncbi:hypothetical protein PROFUN_03640 [Planoprotostelium fungivorum]|uniref:Uncharacterized protein n=1 Tax=Planoprotostelium fungivorum TaxID=1890364 RepID=A0A2P6NSE7_9EUKA|nr:hypothetical protein PROFUN_03640 [Planoprotostelium fungivorum]